MDLDTQLNVLGDTLTLKVRCREQPKIKFNAQFSSITCYGVETMAIKAGNAVKLSIQPVDSFGNKASVDGAPVWNLADDGLGTLAVAANGLDAVFTSSGKVGSALVEVAADVDLSDGVRNLGGSVSIDIEAGEAVDLGVRAEPIVIEAAPITPEAAAVIADAGEASPAVTTVDVLPEVAVGEVDQAVVDAAAAAVDTAAAPADATAASTTDAAAGEQAAIDAGNAAIDQTTV